MLMFKRIFTSHLLVGMGLTLVLGVGSAAEGPGAEPVAEKAVAEGVGSAAENPGAEPVTEDAAAELVRVEGKVQVDGQVQSVRAALKEGDRVSVAEGGTAVIEYREGCRYTVEGGADYSVNKEQCDCYARLDASKHSRHDAIAVFGRLDGQVTVDKGGPQYIDGVVGMELKGGDRVMASEDSSAMVEYYFGCDYEVTEEVSPYTVNAEECCAALALLPEPALAAPSAAPAPAIAAAPIVAGIVGAGAVGAAALDTGSSGSAISPPQPISP